jgi:serine/threonine protein kinase
MSYCLNFDCQKPQNPHGAKFCQNCGSKLLLGDRYRALKLIVRGGFGRTFLAVDEYKPSKPRCVIKQFFYQGAGTQKAAELFEQEAVRLDELGKHPQIPELLAHFGQDHYKYLVQEFIDGQNLAQELENRGAFNENQICQLLADLLPVLQFIHSHQVIHRDIKPENIIYPSSGGKLVLVDFGAAKFTSGVTQTSRGTVIGTPEYVAPEQALGKARYASDLYSLGVTCIHLLTQIHPFQLYSDSENAWVWRDYLGSSVSDSLGRILDKMLESEIHRRYQAAEDVLKDLRQTEAEYYYKQGRKKAERGQYREAIDYFNQAISINLSYAEPFYFRGLANARLGENQAAIEDFQKAADLYQQQGKKADYQKALDYIIRLNSFKYTLESLDINNQRLVAKQIFGSDTDSIPDDRLVMEITKFIESITQTERKEDYITDWDIIDLWRKYLLDVVQKIEVSHQYQKDKDLVILELKALIKDSQFGKTLKCLVKDFFALMYDSLEEKEKDEFWNKVIDDLQENKFHVKKEELKKAGLKGVLFGTAGLSTLLIPVVSRIMLQKMTQGLLGWILITFLGREALKRAALGVLGGPIGWTISIGFAAWTGLSAFSKYQNETKKAKFIQAILSVYLLAS